MATQEAFKKFFIGELWRKYKQEKFPPERVAFLWDRMKNYPDSILAECAVEVIAKNMYAPGVDKVLDIVKEIYTRHQRENAKNIAVDRSCQCGGSGVRCIDNYAFQCPCPAGKMNHPNAPLYTGQAPFIEKFSESATESTKETRSCIHRTDKTTGKTSFYIKESPWRDHNRKGNDRNNDKAREAYENF